MNQAVVTIGSNVDPDHNIPAALNRLAEGQHVLSQSRFVSTMPLGGPDQENFVNGAVLIETDMTRPQLRAWLRDVESELGRVRTGDKNAPRTIDLDIVVFNGRVIDADVYERDFLYAEVAELWPGALMANSG